MPLKPLKPVKIVKRPKLKLSYRDRLRGIVLLRQGKSLAEASRILSKRHSSVSLADLEHAYFPLRGSFAARRFEGLSREKIKRLFLDKFQKNAKAHRERFRLLHADSVFAA